MFYTTQANDHGFPYDPFKAIVTPRPIGWIGSVDKDGVANLAPHSYFNAISDNPYFVILVLSLIKIPYVILKTLVTSPAL